MRNTERVLLNKGVEKILEVERERERGDDIRISDIMEQLTGVYHRIMAEGEMDVGAWSCGMVAGLIHDIPTVRELVDQTMSQAESLITARLGGMLRH
jgi:nitronate monooxygenase